MGNASSATTPAPGLNYYTHPQINDNYSYKYRQKLHKVIKKNDAFGTRHGLVNIPINANLNPRGYDQYISFHVAAEFNAYNSMEALIEYGKKFNHDVKTMSAIPNAQGQNAAVICVMRDASETFAVLVRENLVSAHTQDSKGQSITDLCRQHAPKCLSVLQGSYA